MKLIIAGSRDLDPYLVPEAVAAALLANPEWGITEIVSGHCPRGIDKGGEWYAQASKIPCRLFPADWNKHGKSAGYIRNEEMAKYGDGLLAVWDGKSRGTKHMIDLAHKHGLKVFVYEPSS